jgi:hypothetical protein
VRDRLGDMTRIDLEDRVLDVNQNKLVEMGIDKKGRDLSHHTCHPTDQSFPFGGVSRRS